MKKKVVITFEIEVEGDNLEDLSPCEIASELNYTLDGNDEFNVVGNDIIDWYETN